MNRNDARTRVHRARIELDQAEQQLAERWQPWRERFQRHRLSVLIGSGLIGGFALATVSPRRWSGVGAAIFGGSAWLARSPIGLTALGALWTAVLGSSKTTPRATRGDSGPASPSA